MTFDEFEKRKTAEATGADLPPYVTVLEQPGEEALGVGSTWSRRLFDGDFYLSPVPAIDLPQGSPPAAARPACSLVFVQSLDGNTGAKNPSSLGGGDTDKYLIYEGLSRVAADAVMAGAETIRGGNTIFSVWHPELVRLRAALRKLRHPIQVIATLRGLDLSRGLMFNTPDIRVVIITVRACAQAMRESLAARPWIETIEMEESNHLPEAFAALRMRGVERVSCVGGRNLARQLIDAGLVDDVYVTISPQPGGESGTPLYPGPLPLDRNVLKKEGTGVERGVVFIHYARR